MTEQSIRDELWELLDEIVNSDHGGDMKPQADLLLSSPVIRRIQAEAWELGRKAGNRHGGSYAINPYRKGVGA